MLVSQTRKVTYWFGNDSIKGIEKVVEVLSRDTTILNGEYLHFFQSGGIRIKGVFKDNKPTGVWDYNFESGELKHRVNYKTDSTSYWVYYFENGEKKKEGRVLNHKRDSLWTYYYEKGTVLKQGEYNKDLQDLQWNYYYEDGESKAVALYDKGAGDYTEYYYKGSVKMSGPVSENVSNGVWSYYYETGNLKSKGYEKDGVKNGQWQYFYSNDSLASRGNYLNGAKQGEWQFYYENGVLSSEGIMSDGLRDGYWKLFNDKGGFKADANLLNGTGVYKEYHDNNKLKVDGYLKEDKNHGHWDYFYDDGTLEGKADYIDGEGEYLGYYQSGELKMKGQIKDGKQVGTWELYDKDGSILGYYKLIPSNSKEGEINQIISPTTDNNPPPLLPPEISSQKRPAHNYPRRKEPYRPFQPKKGESRGFIAGGNPLAIVASQVPVSLEYFMQERLGYELRYTIKRNPFFIPDKNIGDSIRYSRGYSIDFKQKFYSKFKEDRGMFYFAHEVRYLNETFFLNSNNKTEFSKLRQNKFEYAWTIGDRVLGDIRYGGVTFDIYAGLGVAYVTQKKSIVSGLEPKFINIPSEEIQLATRLGFALGYLF